MDQATGSLAARFRELKADQPELRAPDAADRMGVTEGELVAARTDGRAILRLAPTTADFGALVTACARSAP
jgi:putative hemin transport protein